MAKPNSAPKKNNSEIMLTVRVTKQMLDSIDKSVSNKYSTRSDFIRHAFEILIDKLKKK